MPRIKNTLAADAANFAQLNSTLQQAIDGYIAACRQSRDRDYSKVWESLAYISGNWCLDLQKHGDKRQVAELIESFTSMMQGAYMMRQMGFAHLALGRGKR